LDVIGGYKHWYASAGLHGSSVSWIFSIDAWPGVPRLGPWDTVRVEGRGVAKHLHWKQEGMVSINLWQNNLEILEITQKIAGESC